jgi:hypothetical protein
VRRFLWHSIKQASAVLNFGPWEQAAIDESFVMNTQDEIRQALRVDEKILMKVVRPIFLPSTF